MCRRGSHGNAVSNDGLVVVIFIVDVDHWRDRWRFGHNLEVGRRPRPRRRDRRSAAGWAVPATGPWQLSHRKHMASMVVMLVPG
eukprot:8070817-Pyramimonas_sp.AAC.1